MAKYRVLQKSFIDSALVNEGDIVEYDGEPGHNLELIEPEAKTKGKKGAASAESEASDQA
jgi:hypothetical protein